MLEQMEQEILNEQKEDDSYIKNLQNECFSDIDRLTSEINQAQTRSEDLQEELDAKIPQRNEDVRILGLKTDL